MFEPPSQRVDRRDSISCPSSTTRARTDGPFPAEQDSPSKSHKLEDQTEATVSLDSSENDRAQSWDVESPDTTMMDMEPTVGTVDAAPSATMAAFGHSHSPSVMTDQEILYEVYRLILEGMETDGADASYAFERASVQPPITLDSLAELDMPRIINNPRLRHDVNFDRELHFRPNTDGSRGYEKQRAADQYWKALEAELFMYGVAIGKRQQADNAESHTYWHRVLKGSQVRLRRVFETVRDILKTLVPDFEQSSITDRLDVDHMMQEVEAGVCDLYDLSQWLANVLKAHCAPMRDGIVDQMREELQNGAMRGDNQLLVNGLRQLLSILEIMKLDVANHQIRHMRPLLIDDAVNFQQKFNAHKIVTGKVNVRGAQSWFDQEIEVLTIPGVALPAPVEVLTSALLRDLLFNDHALSPQTFYLDADRLRTLRVELHRDVYLAICQDILTDMTPSWVARSELAQAQAALRQDISSIVGSSSRFNECRENIAAHIVRVLLLLEGRSNGSCGYDLNLQSLVELRLADEFRPASATFDTHVKDCWARLRPKVDACVSQHVRLSALDLQGAFVSMPVTQRGSTRSSSIRNGAVMVPPMGAGNNDSLDPDDDVVRRLSHVICLHWQVWSSLVYLAPRPMDLEDRMQEAAAEYPSPSLDAEDAAGSPSFGMPSPLPTVPVAHAVYAPGKKWLPIGVTVQDMPTDSGLLTPAPSPCADSMPGSPNQQASQAENEDLDESDL